jgi:hypothetical protein
MDFEVRAALSGNLDQEIEKRRKYLARALTASVHDVADRLKDEWRQQVDSAGLGRLRGTIRTDAFPKGRPSMSLRPAATIYTKAPKIIAAFEEARTVRSPSGKLLLMPNPEVWPGGRVRAATRFYQDGPDGSAQLKAARQRFGPLKVIPPRGGKAGMIVAEGRETRSGRKRGLTARERASRESVPGWDRRNKVQQLVIFWLVPRARLKQRLNSAGLRKDFERRAPALVEAQFQTLLAQLGD